MGKDPYGAALNQDGRFVYSGNLKDNSLSVIDTGTLTVVATVTGLNEPRQAIAFSTDNARAYVSTAISASPWSIARRTRWFRR